MRILMTGATGFVGRSLVLRLHRDRHQVVAWVRDAQRARALLGAEPVIFDDDGALRDQLRGCDAVVNLAGAPVAGKRWTAARKRDIERSRVETTRKLVDAIAALDGPPPTLISASAVGFYGDRGDERLGEASPPGEGFLADICQKWEQEATAASATGTRVVLLRIGVVLGRDGGALAKMLPAFRKGLGGPLGRGDQYVPWIHLADLQELIVAALSDVRYEGPVNATAPEPVTSRELGRELGRALRRPAVLRAPAMALKALFGESATVLLASQRALPVKARELGFEFAYPELAGALAEILTDDRSVELRPFSGPPQEEGPPYLARRKPRYVLEQKTVIDAPIDEVFGFFSRPENLGALTPTELAFEIRSPLPIEMAAGAMIDYRIALGPLPMRWRTVIERWDDAGEVRGFVDAQHRGPYRCWWHEHRFEAIDDDRTRMVDRVLYAPPLGLLGRLANRLFVAPMLRRIFGHRSWAIERRFGRPGSSSARVGVSGSGRRRGRSGPGPAHVRRRAAG